MLCKNCVVKPITSVTIIVDGLQYQVYKGEAADRGPSYVMGGMMLTSDFKFLFNNKVNSTPIEGNKEYVKYGLGEGKDFQGIKYTDFEVDQSCKDYLWNLIPEKHRHQFNMSLMSINRTIHPHTDSNTRTAINWYLISGGYHTSFCTPKPGAKSCKLPTQTNGIIYRFEDVHFDERFKSEDGDVYILDVTKLHCVHSSKGPRVALNLCTNLSYDEVLGMINVHA